MRDFVAVDPDGRRFTLGCGIEALRDVAHHYGFDTEEIVIDPDWIRDCRRRTGSGVEAAIL